MAAVTRQLENACVMVCIMEINASLSHASIIVLCMEFAIPPWVCARVVVDGNHQIAM